MKRLPCSILFLFLNLAWVISCSPLPASLVTASPAATSMPTVAPAATPAPLPPITLDDLPVYPSTAELKSADAHLLDRLIYFGESREAEVKRVLESPQSARRAYLLPLSQVVGFGDLYKFYDEKLAAAGWERGANQSALLENVRQPTDISSMFLASWTHGAQTLVLLYAMSPGSDEMLLALGPER